MTATKGKGIEHWAAIVFVGKRSFVRRWGNWVKGTAAADSQEGWTC